MNECSGEDLLLKSNGVRNAAVGGFLKTASGMFLVLLLPPVLSRALGPERYGAWALCVEWAGYLVLLEAGLGNTVASVLGTLSLSDARRTAHRLIPIGISLACLAGVVAIAASQAIPIVMSAAPAHIRADSQRALILLATPSVVTVASSSIYGFYASRQATLVSGAAIFVSRALAAAGVATLAISGIRLVGLAAIWAGLASLPLLVMSIMFLIYARSLDRKKVEVPFRTVATSCASYFAWAVAGFLVVGLDTTIVARYDFRFLGVYAVAASIPLVLQAAGSALLSPLLPRVAQAAASGQVLQAVQELKRLIFLFGVILGGVAALLLVSPETLTSALAANHSAKAGIIAGTLIIAAAIRLPLLPLSVAMMSVLEHRRFIWLPLVEGLVNVSASLALGSSFGAVGVALGTLIGSAAGVVVTAGWASPRLRHLPDLSALTVMRGSLTALGLASLPVIAWTITSSIAPGGASTTLLGQGPVAAGAVVSLALAIRLTKGAALAPSWRFRRQEVQDGN